jgi:hypothetical protein
MATIQSDIAAKVGKLGAAGLVDPTLYQGNLRFLVATVTLPSTVAANDILELGNLPPGARVLPQHSFMTCHADPGTTLTVDVGTAANTDAYADGSVLSSGGIVNFATAAIPAGITAPVKLSEETLCYATVMSADTVTNNSKVTFTVAYVVG